MNKQNEVWNQHLSLIFSNPIWYFLITESKYSSITSSVLSLIMISVLSLFECIKRSSSLSLEERKLIDAFNRIFHVSDFLRLSMMFYGLILLIYFSTDSVFVSPLLS